jgi:hypothetical protein
LLAQQQDRASAQYHQWLQPEEFADRFGLSSTDVAKAAVRAQSQGLGVEYQPHTRTWLRLSGSAAQVQRAFHIQLHRYGTDSSWLSISPHAGTCPAQITVSARRAPASARESIAPFWYFSRRTRRRNMSARA